MGDRDILDILVLARGLALDSIGRDFIAPMLDLRCPPAPVTVRKQLNSVAQGAGHCQACSGIPASDRRAGVIEEGMGVLIISGCVC